MRLKRYKDELRLECTVCIDLSFICVLVIASFAQLFRVLFFCIASHGQGIYMIRARCLERLDLRALWELLFYFRFVYLARSLLQVDRISHFLFVDTMLLINRAGWQEKV